MFTAAHFVHSSSFSVILVFELISGARTVIDLLRSAQTLPTKCQFSQLECTERMTVNNFSSTCSPFQVNRPTWIVHDLWSYLQPLLHCPYHHLGWRIDSEFTFTYILLSSQDIMWMRFTTMPKYSFHKLLAVKTFAFYHYFVHFAFDIAQFGVFC